MNIILVYEDIKFVLMEECPPESVRNTDQAVCNACKKWVKANEKARCYLLTGMSEVFLL